MRDLWKSRPQADLAADKLRKFAQPQRLMILSLLLEGEKSVSDIDAATTIGQPTLSQQLAELRKAELVSSRRLAKQVYYRLADDSVATCIRSIEAVFGTETPDEAPVRVVKPQVRPLGPGIIRGAANFVKIR